MHLLNICVTEYHEARKEQTLAGRILGLIPSDGQDGIWDIFGDERGAANVGGECVGHDLVSLRVLQAPDALNGDVKGGKCSL